MANESLGRRGPMRSEFQELVAAVRQLVDRVQDGSWNGPEYNALVREFICAAVRIDKDWTDAQMGGEIARDGYAVGAMAEVLSKMASWMEDITDAEEVSIHWQAKEDDTARPTNVLLTLTL